jgi:hypothetical protein
MVSQHEPTHSTPDPFLHPSPLNSRPGMRSKLAIVGFMEQNQRTAPLDDPDFDVAGLNMGNRMGIHADAHDRFRADYWFDIHEEHAQNDLDLAWINFCPVPIYLTHDFGVNPQRNVFRVDLVMRGIFERYGRTPERYFASSFAYIVAWGLARGYTTIGLFGVDMDWGRERVVERGNLEYWIGFANGLGVEVQLSDKSKLMTHPGLYGIEYDKEKQGVEQICAEVMRQLLQSPDVHARYESMLTQRMQALERVRNEARHLVDRILYQTPESAE